MLRKDIMPSLDTVIKSTYEKILELVDAETKKNARVLLNRILKNPKKH